MNFKCAVTNELFLYHCCSEGKVTLDSEMMLSVLSSNIQI